MTDSLAIDVQKRLKELGYPLGSSGPARDGVDGDIQDISLKAILAALRTGAAYAPPAVTADPKTPVPGPVSVIPSTWLPSVRMTGIVVHWTAGNNMPTDFDRAHYHILLNKFGNLVRGIPSIALNDASGVKPGYAAHTRGFNTGKIGVSLAGMAGAVESPFNPGGYPITAEQWEQLPHVLADLCRFYKIPVTRQTVLSHAEVQGTHGVAQAGKWDIARLPFNSSLVGATAIGDDFRKRTAALL